MKTFHITDFDKQRYRPNELFPLVRPFLDPANNSWCCDPSILKKEMDGGFEIQITPDLDKADAVLVSEPLDHRHNPFQYRLLEELNSRCARLGITAHVFVSGDYGKIHPSYSNVIYYRMGGFKSQMDRNNRAFFPLLSDQLACLFNRKDIFPRKKGYKPTVGFCGHASDSLSKYVYEKAKLAQINVHRVVAGDFAFESLFPSAFQRQKLLKLLDLADGVDTNFLLRKRYRAGALTDHERLKTTLEYYNNIINSDYVLCLRGGGNFSARLYETLMMGRIPVFVNTDCLLPLEDQIDWKKHVVWVEWHERNKIAAKIEGFHQEISDNQFNQLQKDNRNLWSRLGVRCYIDAIFSSR